MFICEDGLPRPDENGRWGEADPRGDEDEDEGVGVPFHVAARVVELGETKALGLESR